MYLKIFFILQAIGFYIGMIFLSYYIIRRFWSSGKDEYNITMDKTCSIIWPITLIMMILYAIFLIVKIPFNKFNNILTKIGQLAEYEEEQVVEDEEEDEEEQVEEVDNFNKKFPLIKREQYDGYTGIPAHVGDIICTKDFLDLGIVRNVSHGVPTAILSFYSPYHNREIDFYHCASYGGINYVKWYYTGLSMPLEEWTNLTKKLYEKNHDCKDIYQYFANEVNYSLRR